MKIFYCTDVAPTTYDAPAVHVREIVDNFTALGHTVRSYAPRRQYPLQAVWYQAGLFVRLLARASFDRPDVFYVRQSLLLWVPSAVGKLLRIPIVLEINGRLLDESEYHDRSYRGRLLVYSGIFAFLDAFVVNSARHSIVISEGLRAYMQTRYQADPKRITVITNGVDLEQFRPAQDASRQTLRVGYIGSFYPWQGLAYILYAARKLHAQFPALRFVLIGGGKEHDHLQTLIQKHDLASYVALRPPVSHEDVPRQMRAFDVCICYPTLFRSNATSPLKVYEYLACGKAVIVSDIGGMREEFGDAVVYAEPENTAALAGAIRALIEQPALRAELGARGRSFIERGHSWRAVAERTVSVLSEAVRAKN